MRNKNKTYKLVVWHHWCTPNQEFSNFFALILKKNIVPLLVNFCLFNTSTNFLVYFKTRSSSKHKSTLCFPDARQTNFISSFSRYYSGTGDKSMRGYEFFPRETLQQQINNSQGSSTGAFLQASGEKIYPLPPVDFPGGKSTSDFLLNPELPVPNFGAAQNSNQDLNSQRLKKRKSRKSLQREKLEQTFKEKGFLIQTQQTESAEGATYCKFRQLRKFTRYLFRSWKDYLPGNLAEGEQARGGGSEGAELTVNDLSHDNTDNISVHSSELSTNNAH